VDRLAAPMNEIEAEAKDRPLTVQQECEQLTEPRREREPAYLFEEQIEIVELEAAVLGILGGREKYPLTGYQIVHHDLSRPLPFDAVYCLYRVIDFLCGKEFPQRKKAIAFEVGRPLRNLGVNCLHMRFSSHSSKIKVSIRQISSRSGSKTYIFLAFFV
jgi:hypothetical protein